MFFYHVTQPYDPHFPTPSHPRPNPQLLRFNGTTGTTCTILDDTTRPSFAAPRCIPGGQLWDHNIKISTISVSRMLTATADASAYFSLTTAFPSTIGMFVPSFGFSIADSAVAVEAKEDNVSNLISNIKPFSTLITPLYPQSEEVVMFNHVCAHCAHIVAKHTYTFSVDDGIQESTMECMLCGHGEDTARVMPGRFVPLF